MSRQAMEIDFTNPVRRAALEEARELIVSGYRILRDEVGADNPSDNAFLREAYVCAAAGIVWVGDRGGADGRTVEGDEVEIKSTRLDGRPSVQFPTSRYVSHTVIERFRRAAFWLFAIFDVYEELVALYQVDGADMCPLIDALDTRLRRLDAAGMALQNNPKIPFSAIRPVAQMLYLNPAFVEVERATNGWTLRPR
jgi:hypothetical protein